MEKEYSVVLFFSTSSAIRTEKLARKQGVNVKLIPVPRHLSSDCGICLRFRSTDTKSIKNILDKEIIEYDSIKDM